MTGISDFEDSSSRVESSEDSYDFIPRLNEELRKQAFQPFWMGRIVRGINAINKTHGKCAKIALYTIGTIATASVCSTVYFSGEGAYHLLRDTITAIQTGTPIPSTIGYGGKWSAQVLLFLYFYGVELFKIMREGDYFAFQRVYWFRNYRKLKVNPSILYEHIQINLNHLSHQCFSQKDIFKQKITALKLIDNHESLENCYSDLEIDLQLEELFKRIHKELKSELSSQNYLKRFYSGLVSIGQYNGGGFHGRLAQLSSIITGVCFPIFLCFQSALSFFGAGITFKNTFVDGLDRAAIGQLGEWPANGLVFLCTAKFMLDWGIVSQGDLSIARDIILRHIEEFDLSSIEACIPREILNRRIQELANKELDHLAHQCMFTNLPNYHIWR